AATETGGPARRRLAAPAERDRRPAGLVRRRRHLHSAAAEGERFARPRRSKGGDELFGHRRTVGELAPEHGELAGDVAVGEGDVEAAPADAVDDGEVLGQA